jgi:hypothetical protein
VPENRKIRTLARMRLPGFVSYAMEGPDSAKRTLSVSQSSSLMLSTSSLNTVSCQLPGIREVCALKLVVYTHTLHRGLL